MAYRIRHCRWESGERYCMLVDAQTGIPAWWPTLYITTQVRNRGHSVATMEQALRSIRVLLAYAEAHEIDLEERILTRRLLALHEIDALCDATERKVTENARRGSPETVSRAHQHNRLSTIARYLEWFAREVLREHRTRDDDKAVEDLASAIRERRRRWTVKSRSRVVRSPRHSVTGCLRSSTRTMRRIPSGIGIRESATPSSF